MSTGAGAGAGAGVAVTDAVFVHLRIHSLFAHRVQRPPPDTKRASRRHVKERHSAPLKIGAGGHHHRRPECASPQILHTTYISHGRGRLMKEA